MRALTRLFCAALAAAAAAACEDPGGSRAGPPAAVEAASGNGQTATAGQALPQEVVARVEDARGRPVRGQAVNFVVTGGGGSVFAATVTTDDDGLAANTWTLGPAAGTPQTLEARVSAAGGTLTAVFTATAAAGPAASVARSSSPHFVGTPGAPLDEDLAVLVRDANNNPVAGVQVTWSTATGGSFNPAASTTDANGIARARWTLGNNNTVPQTAQATVAGVGSVGFTAALVNVLQKTGGDGLTVFPGAAINVSVNAHGPPYGYVAGARVRWTVASGGGTVAPPVSDVNTNGVAQAVWTVGTAAGQHTLTASIGGLSTTFTATVLPQGQRTLVATVPGTVLDVSADRVLWVTNTAPYTVHVRTRSTGTDQAASAGLSFKPALGHLFTGGAAYTAAAAGGGETVYEWRGDAPGTLATAIPGTVSFEGGWAAWSASGDVFRRDLAAGMTQPLAQGTAEDVGANGDVVFRNASGLQRWSGAGFTAVPVPSLNASTSRAPAVTDGVKVAYTTFDNMGGGYSIWLVEGGQVVHLTGANAYDPPTWPGYGRTHLLNGGWTAWVEITQRFEGGTARTPLLQVMRRSPAGVDGAVTAENTESMLDALGTDGSVVYRTQSRRYLVPAGGGTYDLGPAAGGERVVYRAGAFYLVTADGSVYSLGT
ncbi:MAG TPA: Ig-like domain-containing protein [Longimicrobium sp.]|nr:Ig-like domain-containing protein [Longimicrobium sp.]